VVADGGGDRRGASGERHMHGLNLDNLAEEIFRADVRTGADTGAAVGEAPAALDELSKVLRRIAGMNGENVRAEGHDGDRTQIVGRETLVSGGGLVDRKRGGGGKNGVAVRRRAAHGSCGEVAAGAAAIFHHHRLPEALAELLSNQAGDDVGNAAGREGDLERDGLRRIALRRSRPCDGGEGRREQDAKRGAESGHTVSFHSRAQCACMIA
jgi:hypothetical protein